MLGSRLLTFAPWTLCALCALSCQLLDRSAAPATPQAASPPSASAAAAAPPVFPPEETPAPEPAPAPAPAPGPSASKPVEPGVANTGAPTRGTLPKTVIDERLRSAAPAIQACYEKALQTKPTLHGNLNVDFVVGADGKVAHAAATDGNEPFDDELATDCILNVVRKLEFPEPKGGRVFLNYPLLLTPPKPAP